MKSSGAENENGGVDKKREAEGQSGVKDRVAHGFAAVANRGPEGTGLHDAGMEIEIVGHDGRAENADSDVKHFAIAKDFDAGDETDGGFAPDGAGEKDLVSEASGDSSDEGDDECFDETEAAALESENDQDVESGDDHAGKKRQAKEEFERNGGAKDFGKIASGDGDFANDPKSDGSAAGVMLAASLRQVATGGDAEFGGERLEKHGHDVADEDDA